MHRNYKLTQQLVACLLLISLCLQSCSTTLNNPPIYREEAITENIQQVNHQVSRPGKGLDLLDSFQTSLLNQLPEDYTLGTAYDNGDCFFDALAQSLNNIKDTNDYTDKSLRIACYYFYGKNKELGTELDLKDKGLKIIDIQDAYAKHEQYYVNIQYTTEEINECIEGRPQVEGRFLCEELNLKEYLCYRSMSESRQCSTNSRISSN